MKENPQENERKFHCTECDYSTNRMDNLSKHIKVKHEDDATSFACQDCDFTSKFRYNLNRHIRNAHNKDKNE